MRKIAVVIIISILMCQFFVTAYEFDDSLLPLGGYDRRTELSRNEKFWQQKGFQTRQSGVYLFVSDVQAAELSWLVDGVFNICESILRNDFFVTAPKETVLVFVFKNESTYQQHIKSILNMYPISPYGHYGHKDRYIVVNYATGAGTLIHETVHAMMAADFPAAPVWLGEGIASLYEQCRVENGSLRGELNWRLPDIKDALIKKQMHSLSTLLSYQATEFRARGESLNYAASRYFCMFMESRGKLREVYHRFRSSQAIDVTGRLAIEASFGMRLEDVETEWHKWILLQQL